MISYLAEGFEKGEKRSYGTPARNAIKAAMPWFGDIPAHTIYGALRDAEISYKDMVRRRACGEACNLPRSRRHTQRSFFMLGNAVTGKSFYPQRLGPMRSAEPLPVKPKDCRVIFEAGKFWLRVPYERAIAHGENQARVCSIDPGIRTFATIYSPEGVGKIGQFAFGRIARLALHLDDLVSRTSKVSGQRKIRMRLAQARMRLRIRNLIQDLHWQVAGWLFRNFDTVIFPEANFTSAVSRLNRKIRAKSVRSLLSFSFAKFRDRLRFKAEILGKSVVTVCESYTSKTHNITGEIKKIGGAKTTTSRGIRIDRDLNGALGIFLKALLAQPSETAHC